jgi:hypothetical protein
MTATLMVGRRFLIPPRFARHRAREFRAFLNTIEANVPDDLDIHMVMDNVSATKLRRSEIGSPNGHGGMCTSRRRRPPGSTRSSSVERFFANLTDKQIRRGVHRSTSELEAAIETYIATVNAHPKPFRWTKSVDNILASIKRFCLATLKTANLQTTIGETSESGH